MMDRLIRWRGLCVNRRGAGKSPGSVRGIENASRNNKAIVSCHLLIRAENRRPQTELKNGNGPVLVQVIITITDPSVNRRRLALQATFNHPNHNGPLYDPTLPDLTTKSVKRPGAPLLLSPLD